MILSLLSLFYLNAMRVEVKPLSYVPSSKITLLDVVETKNLSQSEKKTLKNIELANGLMPNAYRTFNRDFLVELLRNSPGLKQAKIQIPEKAFVANTANVWSKKNLEQSLISKLQEACEACEVQVSIVQFNRIKSAISWDFDLNENLRNQRVYVPVTAEVLNGSDIQARSTQVVADIYFRKEVPVTKENINRGDVISVDDVVMKKILLPSHGRFYTSIDNVVGQKARRVLKQGQLLLFSDVQKAVTVKRGEPVRLLFKNNNIEISMNAIAKESGATGDSIKIQVPDSKKVMQAKIISSSEVEIK